MFGFSIDRLRDSASARDLMHVAISLLLCAVVLFLDVRTSSDITESFLLPLAFLAVYPVKRDWATFLTAVAAVAVVVLGAVLEDEGEAIEAMVFNRGMTVAVIVGVAFLINRVTASEQQLVRIATTDSLTGIFNRRHFMSLLTREHQRAERYQTFFSLLMIDIDHFKRIKDTHGHQIGDEVLRHVSSLLAGQVRNVDRVARYGGEEFALLMVEADRPSAIESMSRLGALLAEVPCFINKDLTIRVTLSAGVATSLEDAGSATELVAAADRALYAAKKGGRNRIVAADGTELGFTTSPLES
jgi:diguanylate cyclase (GGDEF)-like protein